MTLGLEVVRAVRAPVGARFVRSAVAACAALPEVAARLPEGRVEAAIRLTGDRELTRLNRAFLGQDGATDVLAFPTGGSDEAGHLGDIALSVPTAIRQAGAFGHPVESEIALLCVHGFLHVLGWDHVSRAEEAEMNRLTRAALASLGLRLAPGRLAT
jgi:probable rRNA maturation factor